MKIKKIYEEVYKIWVVILVCSQSQFDKKMKTMKLDSSGIDRTDAGAVLTVEDTDGCIYFLVWFKKKPPIEDIAHEAWHLASDILDSRGVEYATGRNKEAFAYYTEYWFNKIKKVVK